jgi:hypothetical protein
MKMCNMWYGEISNFNFSEPKWSDKTGHFSQVVWRSSAEIGIGIAAHEEKFYCVAQYSPPGNVEDQFQENIFPPVVQ